MHDAPDRGPAEGRDPLEIELRLVHEAVRMVASGAARRVVLAGLRFANDLLGSVGEVALEPGVRLLPLWRPDGSGIDIAVEVVSGAASSRDGALLTGAAELIR